MRSTNSSARLFREKPLGAVGAVFCLIFLFAGIFADVLAPYGYNQIMPINRMKPPSWQFWFGTDNLGRDIFSRVLYGARLSVIIGLSAAAIATVISLVHRHHQRLLRRQASTCWCSASSMPG